MAGGASRLRTWILGFLALALLASGLVSLERRLTMPSPLVGVDWAQGRPGPIALTVERGSPAWSAGLVPGDVLEDADGRQVASALDAEGLAWKRSGDPIELHVRRGSRRLRLEFRPEAGRGAPEASVYLAIVAVAFLASGAFIAIRWPTVRGGRAYSLLAACLFVLLVFSHSGRGDVPDWSIHWADVAAGALAPTLLLHLVLSVTRRTASARRAMLAAGYTSTAALVALGVWLVGFGGARRFADPALMAEATDRLQLIFLALSVAISALLLKRSDQRSSSGLHRSQMRWMLWGLGIGLVPFVVTCGLPWALGASVPAWVQFLAVVPMLAMPASFTAALVQYRLHDLDYLLRRGLAEIAAVFCVMAAYAVSKAVLELGLGGVISLSPSGLRYLSIPSAALAYPKLREWVRGGVDKAFYRTRYSYRATLLDFGRELNAETDLSAMLDRLEHRVRETLAVPEARVLVHSGPDRFEATGPSGEVVRLEIEPLVRERLERDRYVLVGPGEIPSLGGARYLFGMRVKDSLRAVLAVAEREEPDPPLSSEDRVLLATLSAHAAAAIEAARLLREVRQQAEHVERLQVRQERILESSAVGLLLMDATRRILACNRALESMFGVLRKEVIGRKIEEILPLHLVRRLERETEAARPGEEVRIYRHVMASRTGQRVVMNLSVSPAVHELTGDGARVVSFDDVTDRVKLEEQVLRQERLASLGLLAAGVAHEVNTPITGISSYVQMMLEEMDPHDPRREMLEKIDAQSRRVSSIANSLLNLARPERAATETLSLNEFVEEVLRLFEPQVRGRGIRMESRLDPYLPAVRAHRAKMQQVLLNLLLNARDAVGDGGTIKVLTGHDRGRVYLDVMDDGVGIAEEDLNRIFDPFFTTKGRGRGTGLGLSISCGIVHEHDGEISVESSPGESTRFRVDLPEEMPARTLAGS